MSKQFRNLDANEIKALFVIYERHKGLVSAMARDEDCQFKNRGQLAHYVRIYNFYHTLSQKITEKLEKEQEEFDAKLRAGKQKAIDRAMELLEPITVLDKMGNPLEIPPGSKAVKTAWEIFKTELGEPTVVRKNENINEDKDRYDEHDQKLKDLIEKRQNGNPSTTTEEHPSNDIGRDSDAGQDGARDDTPVTTDQPGGQGDTVASS